LCIGAAARVLEEQTPVFLPDVSQEMLKHPELASFAPEAVGHSTYLFPVSTSNKRYGILALTKSRTWICCRRLAPRSRSPWTMRSPMAA
jgi:hypothetical protein